jgi:hypothetical protein
MTKLDHAGNAAYSAGFRYTGALQVIGTAFFLLFLASAGLNFWQYRHPPAVIVIRVDDAGRTEPIRYRSGDYTPREAEIVSRLNEWAIYRFRLLRSVIDQDFKKNYFFLESHLARELMTTDADVITKIQASSMAEQDVEIKGITFRSFETRKDPDGTVGAGECVIDFYKIYNLTGQGREHWQITAKYKVNPTAAAERSRRDPAFQLANPLGVTVVWFHEDPLFDKPGETSTR